MDITSFLQRALSARSVSTLYWLRYGGWLLAEQTRGAAPAAPGRPIKIREALAEMRVKSPVKHAEYMSELEASGMSIDELPTVACDCSGFVAWALGVARNSGPPGEPFGSEGWINTDSIHADARSTRKLFRPAERAEPGTLIVYPRPAIRSAEPMPGHIGIVTQVSGDGRPTRVLHCAPRSFLLTPPPGLPRNAIAETDLTLFDADPRSMLVAWRGFDG